MVEEKECGGGEIEIVIEIVWWYCKLIIHKIFYEILWVENI
jgi:hypothetical protein